MTRHTFPAQLPPIIGREVELADLAERLTDPACRLLTIIGPGGVGKTRLAIEASTRARVHFPDGVFFIELQPVEAESFLSTIADALSLSLSGQEPPQVQLFRYLGDKNMLLLLDNFEHLLSQAAFLGELLSQVPSVKFLVTSRETIYLQQEWVYPLHGLPVPPDPSIDDVADYGAVQLFRERARRVRPDFSIDDDRSAVVRICRLVEGLPLALELAASWTRTLACAVIADEIEHNLDFLSRPLRGLPGRHRSMQAVFDQMWELLPEAERRVFQGLSVFQGGFDREAAETVAGASLSMLSTLVDKCMIRREKRYHAHELLRQFGEEKLQRSPQEAEMIRQRHVEYYTTFLSRRIEAIHSVFQRQAAIEIETAWDNVSAAWQRAIANGNIDAIHRAAATLHYFCQLRSRFLEGATALKAAATRLEEEPASRGRNLALAELYNHEGWLRIRIGEFDRAQQILEKSRALYQEIDATPPPYMGTDSSIPLSIIVLIQGNSERAVALCEAARQDAEEREDKQNLAFALYGLAAARSAQGNYKSAYRHAERSCIVARETGNRWFLTYPLIEWGNVARAMGNFEEAEQHYRAAYALKEEFKDPEGMAVTLSRLGDISVRQGRHREAIDLFQQSLTLYHDLNDRGGLATCLKGLGQVAHATKDFPAANQNFRQALQIATEIQFWPLVFSIIYDVAMFLISFKQTPFATSLLTLIQHHPSSRHETKRQAQQQLEVLESKMEAHKFDAAVQQGQEWELERALAKLRSKLAAAEEEDDDQTKREQPLVEPLTERELDVLRLLVKGFTNAEIADELVLAKGTVKWYASQIYRKLGVSNRTQAAAQARSLDLISR